MYKDLATGAVFIFHVSSLFCAFYFYDSLMIVTNMMRCFQAPCVKLIIFTLFLFSHCSDPGFAICVCSKRLKDCHSLMYIYPILPCFSSFGVPAAIRCPLCFQKMASTSVLRSTQPHKLPDAKLALQLKSYTCHEPNFSTARSPLIIMLFQKHFCVGGAPFGVQIEMTASD